MADIITRYNVKNYFDIKSVSKSQIKPGMIIDFGYWSPDGVHDNHPLVYVLEVEYDRIWGMNLHYKFILMADIMKTKKNELISYNLLQQKYEKPIHESSHQNNSNKESLNEDILPHLPHLKRLLPVKAIPSFKSKPKITPIQKKGPLKPGEKQPEVKPGAVKTQIPLSLLEEFTLRVKPTTILRNYLPGRMRGINKLVYKIK